MSGHIGDMVSQDWNTPDYLLDAVRRVIGGPIDLDPCDNDWSTTRARVSYKLPGNNGLTDSWLVAPDGSLIQNVFCNPPYGRTLLNKGRIIITKEEYKAMSKEDRRKVVVTDIGDWIQKAANYEGDQEMFMLIPSSTELAAWHDFLFTTASAICFIRGRVKHPLQGQEVASSTKGSAMIFWGVTGRAPVFEREFEPYGKVWIL